MRRSTCLRPALLVSTLAVIGLFACKQEEPEVAAKDYPAQMALSYCNAVFNCQCDDYPYNDPNACFADLLTEYNALNDAAFVSGLLAYDGTCPAQEIDTIEALACKGSIPPSPEGVCIPPCYAWHGNLTAGFSCQTVASSVELGLAFSNCSQGLSCIGGICVNLCQTGPMLPGIGQPCLDGACAAGAMCDEGTMTCVAEQALPGPGQPCVNGACDPRTSVCVAEANTCAALPAVGQPCVEGQCNADGFCNSDNLCEARPALACFLLSGGGTGDGDGDPTGDGDGDPTGDGDGDGDGDGGCLGTALPSEVPLAWPGNNSADPAVDVGSCGGDGPEAQLTYVAPTTGVYMMSTEGSEIDTILYVRDGSCTGTEIACDDDTLAPASYLEVALSAGQEVAIFVDSYDVGGNYVLQIDML